MKALQKSRIGTVISDKMDKTVVVSVETRKPHPRYHRMVRYRAKFKAHDEANACRVGDPVRIVESRPLSKEKRWRVVENLSQGALTMPPHHQIAKRDDPVLHSP